MRFSTQIKPISYVKAHAAELLDRITEEREPIIITQNGEARAVLVDVRSYEECCRRLSAAANPGDGGKGDRSRGDSADRGSDGRIRRRSARSSLYGLYEFTADARSTICEAFTTDIAEHDSAANADYVARSIVRAALDTAGLPRSWRPAAGIAVRGEPRLPSDLFQALSTFMYAFAPIRVH